MTAFAGAALADLVLHGDRLALRPWRDADAPAVVAIMADERMSEFLPLPRPYTLSDARSFVGGLARRTREDGQSLHCAMFDGDRLVGAASLDLTEAGTGRGTIGYWVASAEWGRGYATEATKVLAEFGFAGGLRRIALLADIGNAASAAVALRAGFRYEGTMRASHDSQHGPADHALFARLAGDDGQPVPPALPRFAPVEDGTVELRPVAAGDWPVVHAEQANPEAMRWGFGDEPSEAQARARCRRAGLNWLVGGPADLLISEVATGTGAGVISLRRAGPPGVLALGYGIRPEFRGRRFTTRALVLLADWVFARTDTERLELGCKAANRASARSAELAGFVEEGRLRNRLRNPDGSYAEEILFGRTRSG